MSPAFWGSEPVTAKSGKFAGTSILQVEQGQGLALFKALSADQRAKAVLAASKTGNDNVGEAFKDNVVLAYAGVRAKELDAGQREQLLALVGEYVGNLRDDQARVQMSDVRKHLDDTYFAWIGGSAPDSVFYYRIHSPVILIEFDHQQPANLRHLAKDPPGAHPRAHPHGGPYAERKRLRQGPAAPALRGSPARPLSPPRSAGAATGARSRSGLPRPRTARPGPGWSRSRPRPQRARRWRCCSGP